MLTFYHLRPYIMNNHTKSNNDVDRCRHSSQKQRHANASNTHSHISSSSSSSCNSKSESTSNHNSSNSSSSSSCSIDIPQVRNVATEQMRHYRMQIQDRDYNLAMAHYNNRRRFQKLVGGAVDMAYAPRLFSPPDPSSSAVAGQQTSSFKVTKPPKPFNFDDFVYSAAATSTTTSTTATATATDTTTTNPFNSQDNFASSHKHIKLAYSNSDSKYKNKSNIKRSKRYLDLVDGVGVDCVDGGGGVVFDGNDEQPMSSIRANTNVGNYGSMNSFNCDCEQSSLLSNLIYQHCDGLDEETVSNAQPSNLATYTIGCEHLLNVDESNVLDFGNPYDVCDADEIAKEACEYFESYIKEVDFAKVNSITKPDMPEESSMKMGETYMTSQKVLADSDPAPLVLLTPPPSTTDIDVDETDKFVKSRPDTPYNFSDSDETVLLVQQVTPSSSVATPQDQQQQPPKPRNRVIFVEGPSCIGKTTVSDNSLDYTRYVASCPMYAQKHADPAVQALYNSKLATEFYSAIMQRSLCTEQMEDLYVDRSIFSSLIYEALFKLDGHQAEHAVFCQQVEEQYIEREGFVEELSRVWNDILKFITMMAPNLDVGLIWIIPKSVYDVAALLEKRNTMEVAMNFNLLEYVRNQTYMFEEFARLSGVGCIMKVDTPVDRAAIQEYLQYRD